MDERTPIALIVQAAALNAALATGLSAFAIALSYGAGIEEPDPQTFHPLDLAKATAFLCPITAVSCGSFGLAAGSVGAALMVARRHRIRSTKRLLIEAGIAGLILGPAFPFFDRWMNPNSGTFLTMISLLAGVPCALICAFVFRKRFLALHVI